MGTELDVRRYQGGVENRRRRLPTSYMAAVLHYATCSEMREPRELHGQLLRHSQRYWKDGAAPACLSSAEEYLASDRSRFAHQLVSEMARLATKEEIKRELHVLVGSFPNAAKADLQIYGRALALDVIDHEPTVEAMIVACMTLRRLSTFLPTISEVLKWVKLIDEYVIEDWKVLCELPALHSEGRQRVGVA